MANLTISADWSLASVNLNVVPLQVGEAVTKFMPIYASSDGKYYKAVSSSEAAARASAIALTAAGIDGWTLALRPGSSIALGTLFTAGQVYVVSATAGLIAEVGDLAGGQYQCVLGQARSTSVLDFDPLAVVQV